MKQMLLMMILAPAVLFAGIRNIQTEPNQGMQGTSMMMDCPMKLEGTSVAVADTPTGVTVSITTKNENVAELRKRVEKMAAMHSPDANRPSAAMKQGQMMPGSVKYEAIENGARLTLTPKDPAKIDEFRKQVRAHVEKMQKGECAMMQDMMQGMMHGMRSGMGASNATPKTKEDPKKDDDHGAHHPETK